MSDIAHASAETANALTNGLGGIVGVKAGMTQVYAESGQSLGVTVIALRPNLVTQVKTSASDGYSAVQVALVEERNPTMAELGHLKKLGHDDRDTGFKKYTEFRFSKDSEIEGIQPGQILSASFLKVGDFIDVTSVSKGKGFQGVMKRYNFKGGKDSHGHSVSHRQIGSIGNRADPGKVFKGKKMAGHMGFQKVTVQNVKIVAIDLDKGFLLVHGSVPGPRSSIVRIRRAVKV